VRRYERRVAVLLPNAARQVHQCLCVVEINRQVPPERLKEDNNHNHELLLAQVNGTCHGGVADLHIAVLHPDSIGKYRNGWNIVG